MSMYRTAMSFLAIYGLLLFAGCVTSSTKLIVCSMPFGACAMLCYLVVSYQARKSGQPQEGGRHRGT